MSDPSGQDPTESLYQQALDTFEALLQKAKASGDPEPTAMTLATAGEKRLSARIVLLKGVDARGFRFFTNYESAKARAIRGHHRVALCFHWKHLPGGVQVRVEGAAHMLPPTESDAYFATRARGSQIGAWASLQSQVLTDRAAFEARLDEVERRFAGVEVPRPPHWGGYVVEPARIEFWYGADFRLHERVLYARDDAGAWSTHLLYP